MLRSVVLAVVLVLANGGATLATETTTPDGRWWQSLNQSEKVAAILGLYGGFKQGWLQGSLAALDVSHQPLNLLTRVNARYPDAGGFISFGTISDRIDAVYRDHSSLQSMPVYILFPCSIEEAGCGAVVRANENTLRQGLKPAW